MGFAEARASSLLPPTQEQLRARFPAGPRWEETTAGRNGQRWTGVGTAWAVSEDFRQARVGGRGRQLPAAA